MIDFICTPVRVQSPIIAYSVFIHSESVRIIDETAATQLRRPQQYELRAAAGASRRISRRREDGERGDEPNAGGPAWTVACPRTDDDLNGVLP